MQGQVPTINEPDDYVPLSAFTRDARWIIRRHLVARFGSAQYKISRTYLASVTKADLLQIPNVADFRANIALSEIDAAIKCGRIIVGPQTRNPSTSIELGSPMRTSADPKDLEPKDAYLYLPLDLARMLKRLPRNEEFQYQGAFHIETLHGLTAQDFQKLNGFGVARAARFIRQLQQFLHESESKNSHDELEASDLELIDDELATFLEGLLHNVSITKYAPSSSRSKRLSETTQSTRRNLPFTELVREHPHQLITIFGDSWVEDASRFYRKYLSQQNLQDKENIAKMAALELALPIAAIENWSLDDWQIKLNANIELLSSASFFSQNLSNKRTSLYVNSLSIVLKLSSGQTLEQVGQELGVTRERVRQIAKKLNFSQRENQQKRQAQKTLDNERFQVEQSHLLLQIATAIRESPGCTLKEVSQLVDLDLTTELVAMAGCAHLLLADSDLSTSALESPVLSPTETEALQSLRAAATLTFPVTVKAYDDLRRRNFINGVSGVRITQIFGSWTRACELANVEAGTTMRQSYNRLWTREELLDTVLRYLCDPNYSGAVHRYEDWRESQVNNFDIAGMGTIRNQISRSWVDTRREALLRARDLRSGQERKS